ncbi:c-type cytochrome [Chelatococcus sp. GCM10030263]|uniref:c-type cytochrome n=1 Tax=Chelatococcus sp. GCM10030263 TaxID=3273387 RepID=UPI00361ABB2F
MTVRTILLFALLTTAAGQAAMAQSPGSDGERLFRTRCASCHSIEPGQNRIGPPLAGVFGRAAGSVAGARYSEALRTSGLTWNEETLNTYLANPRQAVPGTTMTIGLSNADQRNAIIAYLRDLPVKN